MPRTLAPQTGTAFYLKKGQRLCIVDPEGQQVCDLFCFDAENQGEVLSSGRSIDYADTILLTKGHKLYSNHSGEMLEITEDLCGRNDFLLTPCSRRMFELENPPRIGHKNCDDNLATAFGELGRGTPVMGTTFNIFMNVEVGPQGEIKILPPRSRPGDKVVFRALRDLIVAICACSHEDTNGGRCKPIQWDIF